MRVTEHDREAILRRFRAAVEGSTVSELATIQQQFTRTTAKGKTVLGDYGTDELALAYLRNRIAYKQRESAGDSTPSMEQRVQELTRKHHVSTTIAEQYLKRRAAPSAPAPEPKLDEQEDLQTQRANLESFYVSNGK